MGGESTTFKPLVTVLCCEITVINSQTLVSDSTTIKPLVTVQCCEIIVINSQALVSETCI